MKQSRQKWFVAIAAWADATNSDTSFLESGEIDKLRNRITQEVDASTEAMLWGRVEAAWGQVEAAYKQQAKAWSGFTALKNDSDFGEVFDRAWDQLEKAKTMCVEFAANNDEVDWVNIKRTRLEYLYGNFDYEVQ